VPFLSRNRGPTHPDVLLETVATSTHEGSKPCASRGASEDGHLARDQSQKLLASFTDSSNANCNAQQMADGTWTSFAQTTLVRPCSASRNRATSIVVGWTRILGGVGRAVSDGGPSPIYSATSGMDQGKVDAQNAAREWTASKTPWPSGTWKVYPIATIFSLFGSSTG